MFNEQSRKGCRTEKWGEGIEILGEKQKKRYSYMESNSYEYVGTYCTCIFVYVVERRVTHILESILAMSRPPHRLNFVLLAKVHRSRF